MQTYLRYATSTITIALVALTAGCVSIEPRLVSDPSVRYEGSGYSILPPSGAHWYGIQGANYIGFGKLDPAHYRQRSDRLHTFVVLATSDRVDGVDIRTNEGLMQILDQLTRRADPPRFRFISRTLDPYREQETDCARFEAAFEERNNPHAPGVVFLETGGGKFCRNPLAPEYIVMVSWSERRPVGHESMLDDRLRAECAHAIDSLRFSDMLQR